MPVSLVGWSRGGIIAREATRLAPEAVRMVITLGSPFAAPAATNVMSAWRLITGEKFLAPSPEQVRQLALPLPVPSTSIYSRTDGVVRLAGLPGSRKVRSGERRGARRAYRARLQPVALWVIADRLAQPLGAWAPFRPGPLVAAIFPRARRTGS